MLHKLFNHRTKGRKFDAPIAMVGVFPSWHKPARLGAQLLLGALCPQGLCKEHSNPSASWVVFAA